MSNREYGEIEGTDEAVGLRGIMVKTLQRWKREDRLVPAAGTTNNRRRYVLCFSSRPQDLRNYRQLRVALESDRVPGTPDQD